MILINWMSLEEDSPQSKVLTTIILRTGTGVNGGSLFIWRKINVFIMKYMIKCPYLRFFTPFSIYFHIWTQKTSFEFSCSSRFIHFLIKILEILESRNMGPYLPRRILIKYHILIIILNVVKPWRYQGTVKLMWKKDFLNDNIV